MNENTPPPNVTMQDVLQAYEGFCGAIFHDFAVGLLRDLEHTWTDRRVRPWRFLRQRRPYRRRTVLTYARLHPLSRRRKLLRVAVKRCESE